MYRQYAWFYIQYTELLLANRKTCNCCPILSNHICGTPQNRVFVDNIPWLWVVIKIAYFIIMPRNVLQSTVVGWNCYYFPWIRSQYQQRHTVYMNYVTFLSLLKYFLIWILLRRRSLNISINSLKFTTKKCIKNRSLLCPVALKAWNENNSPISADCHVYDPDFDSTLNWTRAVPYKSTTIERIPKRYFNCHHFLEILFVTTISNYLYRAWQQ